MIIEHYDTRENDASDAHERSKKDIDSLKTLMPSVIRATLFALSVCIAASLARAENVLDLTPDNFAKVGSSHSLDLMNLVGSKNLAPTYEDLATTYLPYKDDVVIAKVDADKHKDLGSKFGVSGFPTIKWFPKGSTTPEEYSGGRDIGDFVQFINGKTGLKAKVKKIVVPSDVLVLDASNFDDEVLNSDANVLVEFYAPWCGHCKNLAPTYAKVASAFKTESKCRVANFDATTSQSIPGRYDVTGYPTIKFFEAGKKDPVPYEGGRSEEDFIEFLNEKCGTKRTVGGGLTEDAGLIPELDAIIADFLKASAKERTKLITKAKNLAKNAKSKAADYYVKALEKSQSATDYAAKELARLERMLGLPAAQEKKDDMTIRRNILKVFKNADEACLCLGFLVFSSFANQAESVTEARTFRGTIFGDHTDATTEDSMPLDTTLPDDVEDPCAADLTDPPELGLHIAAVFIQVAISLFGTLIPILLKRYNLGGSRTDTVFEIIRNFGTGIILATGFVHMLIPAVELLASECLPSGWTNYEALAGVFAMAGIIVVQILQTLAIGVLSNTSKKARSALDIEKSPSFGGEKKVSDQDSGATEIAIVPEGHSAEDGHGHLRDALFGEGAVSDELKKKQVTVYVLELGIASHSFFVGLALGTARGSELRALMVALAFHQFFEGMALSATLIDAKFTSKLPLIIMVCLYTIITPLGVSVGAGINSTFNPNSNAALLTQGIMDAFAAGILIYDSLEPQPLFATALAEAADVALSHIEIYPRAIKVERIPGVREIVVHLENPCLSGHSMSSCLVRRAATIVGNLRSAVKVDLVRWFSKYDESGLDRIVKAFQAFVSDNFSQNLQSNDAVVSAVKTLQLFYHANESAIPRPLPLSAFYNSAVAELNFKEEYRTWRRILDARATGATLGAGGSGGAGGERAFSWFSYPFLFDAVSKTKVIRIDSMVQMSVEFEDAFVNHALVIHAQRFFQDSPSVTGLEDRLREHVMPYLVLEVRREKLVADVLLQITKKEKDLKKPLRVKFVGGGEEGMDQGGVQKEFFQVVVNNLLDPAYGLFTYDEETRFSWINGWSPEPSSTFELAGVILGLALFNGVIVDVHFPKLVYKKLLGEEPTLEDIKEAFPALGRGLEQMLQWDDGDVSDVFMRSFEVDYDVYGKVVTHQLIENGSNVPVTNQNRREFVALYVEHLAKESVRRPFDAFKRGFYKVCGGGALKMCRPEELELMLCGSDDLNFGELEKAAEYDGFAPEDQFIR
ncbi:hypothetical protein HDU93_006732 [Gonapodya sp. JEL0774]|nr:hypothetical protein HDU93_006732 [Gonapodya sp. JEL0774]